jgi:PAS domain S-box-containing protein
MSTVRESPPPLNRAASGSRRVSNEGRQRSSLRPNAHRQRTLFNDLVRVLSLVLDFDEGSKLFHAWRVALLAREVGHALGRDGDLLFHAGLVHDLGGLGLSDHVVHHARIGFSRDEARMHSTRGARILRPLTALRPLASIVEHHHERSDGGGFPLGLVGDEVPLDASILHLADQLEVALRGETPARRSGRAVRVALQLRGTACPPEVSEAALRILAADGDLVAELYEPGALDARVRAVQAEPAGLADVSEVDLLAQLLWVLARVVDTKHSHTMGHSARVAFHARHIALRLGAAVDPWDVVWAGLLHDLGNVAVPRAVLDKTEPLGADDWALIRSHPRHTRELVSGIARLSHLALAASAHHEAWDGSGYPLGLSGEAIPLIGRILAYADRFDGLRSDRAHRKGLDADAALAAMRGLVGTVLDPSLADVALQSLALSADAPSASADLLGFQQFFQSDEPNLERVVQASVPQEGLAARWCTVRLDETGLIQEGGAALGALTAVGSPRVLDHVAPGSRPKLQEELERVRAGETIASAHATPSGLPLELVVGRFGRDMVAQVRRASPGWRSMRDLALVHRNFLLSSEAVVFTDAEARIVDVNYAFTRMFGWRTEEVVGRTPKLLQSGQHPPSLYREMRESLADPLVGAWSGELVNRSKSGEPIAVQLTINAVRDPSGRVVGYVSNAIDVTARRRAQQALEERERELLSKNADLERLSRFKSQMVAITSHDLRSPLASMIGLAELVRESCVELGSEQLGAQVGMIADTGHRLVGLVNDLLDLDKCESGTLELNLRRISAEGLVRAVGATLPGRHEPALPPGDDEPEHLVIADADRVEQALTNLVGNALKFSPRDSITIGCDALRTGAVRLWVADCGPGLPDDAVESVFDRYVQVDRGGAVPQRGAGVGLGLAIVRHMAELHRGRAHAENRPGGGCCFALDLPSKGPSEGPAPSALLLGPRSDDLDGAARIFRRGGMCVLASDRLSEARRRLTFEAPSLVVVDERWLDAELLEALGRVRRRPASFVAVLREEEPSGRDARFDWELLSPLMDVEVASVMRSVLARARETQR